jgi:hypothetical protein
VLRQEKFGEVTLPVVCLSAQITLQAVRVAGAALVDKDEIAVTPERPHERVLAGARHARLSLSRPAGKEKDRIGTRRA